MNEFGGNFHFHASTRASMKDANDCADIKPTILIVKSVTKQLDIIVANCASPATD